MSITDPAQLRDLLGIPFSDQQLAAIAAPLEPAVIIAGAGSGKTTVMAARVVWLVAAGYVRPDQVLGLTFTRKAAGELSSRVRRALTEAGVVDPEGGEELVLTYDAFAGRLVAEHGLLLGIEPGQRMITGAARYRLAARAVADAVGPMKHLSRLRPATVTDRLVNLAAEMRSHLVSPATLASHAEIFVAALNAAPRRSGTLEYKAVSDARAAEAERLELASLVVAYEELKADLGYVEFADQMWQAARLATEVPLVGESARAEFAVVLLDEYQDTSAAQAQLLRGLFSGADPEHGQGHPVTAVGDPCQAIYGWRGAAANNILDFAEHFPRADGRAAPAYALTVNRRSGQRVLDAANQLAQGVRSDPALTSHGLDLALVAPPQTPPGQVEVAAFVSWDEEVAAIADRTADLHAGGTVAAWSDIAVLCRRNTQVAAVYAALIERDIPAEIVGLGGLLDLPPVADVVATLEVLADPAANPATVRLLSSPRWAIGIPDLAALGRRARELARDRVSETEAVLETVASAGEAAQPSLIEAAADPGAGRYSSEARARFAEFTAELGRLRRHSADGLIELVTRVIATLGLIIETEVATPGGSAPLHALVQAVAGYADIDADASLTGLLAWFEAERTYGVSLDQPVRSLADSVKVLTVHRAKGLEWEAVFVPGLASGVFPASRVTGNWLRSAAVLPYPLRGDAAALPQLGRVDHQQMASFGDELTTQQGLSEDRLAYVAVTRARQLLMASTHTWQESLSRPREPSRYFSVLAEHADRVNLPAEIPSVNPLVMAAERCEWPTVTGESFELRRAAAAEVAAARTRQAETGNYHPAGLELDVQARVRRWQEAGEELIAAELIARREAETPAAAYLSVTGVGRLNRDPQGFAAALRRPLPRLVTDAQRWGVGFHQWLEARFARQAALVTDEPPLELAGGDFERLRAGFEAGPYAQLVPLAVEEPFTLVLGGHLVRGRIDAVFPSATGAQVVDWKTGNIAKADPLQLACYRLAWAELNGLDPEEVDAVFYDLHTAQVVRPVGLPGRAELTALLAARLD